MKTKIICPRDRVEAVFHALLDKDFTFEFRYRVECVFLVPHLPAVAMQTILRQAMPLSRTVELCQFSDV